MKIRADRKALADTVHWVAQALPKNPAIASLAGIRLQAEGDHLTLSAFDYDVAHEARIKVEVMSEGQCLVSGAFLRTMTAALSGKEVELILQVQRLVIQSGRSEYRANLLELEDYPTLPPVPKSSGTIDAALLADGVTSCLGPIDDAAAIQSVAGLRIEATSDALELVGLDGRLLIHRTLDWSGDSFEVTLPSKAVAAAVNGLDSVASIGATDSAIGFSDHERTVVIRTIATQYVDWRKVPRAESEDRFAVIVERDDLAEAVKRAGLLARTAKDAGAVTLIVERDYIEVTATDATAGGSEVIDAESDGCEVIPFSPILLGQALAAMEQGPIRIGIGKRRKVDMAALTTIRPTQRAISEDREAVIAARQGGEAR